MICSRCEVVLADWEIQQSRDVGFTGAYCSKCFDEGSKRFIKAINDIIIDRGIEEINKHAREGNSESDTISGTDKPDLEDRPTFYKVERSDSE